MKKFFKALGIVLIMGLILLGGIYYLMVYCDGWYMTGQCN